MDHRYNLERYKYALVIREFLEEQPENNLQIFRIIRFIQIPNSDDQVAEQVRHFLSEFFDCSRTINNQI